MNTQQFQIFLSMSFQPGVQHLINFESSRTILSRSHSLLKTLPLIVDYEPIQIAELCWAFLGNILLGVFRLFYTLYILSDHD